MTSLLSERTLAWVGGLAGKNAKLWSAEPLKGGISSAVYALELEVPGDRRVHWVMRQFTDKSWLEAEPDLAMHESAALKAALETGLPSPEWIGVDYTGERCGLPTVVMSLLPGRVVLPDTPASSWLRGLAGTLARLHGARVEPVKWNYFTYNKVCDLKVPDWTHRPEAWSAVIERVQRPAPSYEPRFIHRDYHPANVLWLNDKVSGVVDWVNACMGPAGIDTGHCRLNLVQLYGVGTADAFLETYLQSPGSVRDGADPFWDMLSLIEVLPGPPEVYTGWKDLGFCGLRAELIARRLDEYADRLVQKALC